QWLSHRPGRSGGGGRQIRYSRHRHHHPFRPYQPAAQPPLIMNEADVLRVIVALVFILMVLLAGAWAVRRAGLARGAGTQSLRVLASQNLGGRALVVIVEVEDARLVLGVTAQQVNLLHTLPPTSSESTGTSAQALVDNPGFTSALSRALKRR